MQTRLYWQAKQDWDSCATSILHGMLHYMEEPQFCILTNSSLGFPWMKQVHAGGCSICKTSITCGSCCFLEGWVWCLKLGVLSWVWCHLLADLLIYSSQELAQSAREDCTCQGWQCWTWHQFATDWVFGEQSCHPICQRGNFFNSHVQWLKLHFGFSVIFAQPK